MTIALAIRTKLNRELPTLDEEVNSMGAKQRSELSKGKIDVVVSEGKHETKDQIDKQVNDKERVLAAMENESVVAAIEDLIRKRNFV